MTLIASCASKPCSLSKSQPIKPKNIYQFLGKKDSARTIPVTIIRDTGFHGSATGIVVKLNGELLAKFYPADRYTFYLEEGLYVFGAYMDLVFERGIIHELEAEITSRTLNNFRLTIDRGSRGYRIQRTAEF